MDWIQRRSCATWLSALPNIQSIALTSYCLGEWSQQGLRSRLPREDLNFLTLYNHRLALEELQRFERPIAELEAAWLELPFDYDGDSVILTRANLKHALQLRIIGESPVRTWSFGLI